MWTTLHHREKTTLYFFCVSHFWITEIKSFYDMTGCNIYSFEHGKQGGKKPLLCRTLSWNNYKIELISIISWETEVSARYQLHTYTYKFWLPLLTRDSYQKLLFPLSLLFTCCLMPGKETSLNIFFQLVLYSVIFFL